MKKENNIFLRERYVYDLLKPEVDYFERAAIIRELMEAKDLSQREFGLMYGVPHSTVQDWLLFNLISEDEYRKKVAEGYNHTAIYKALRDKRSLNGKGNNNKFLIIADVDILIQEFRKRLKALRSGKNYSPKTMALIDETVNDLNSYGADINRWRK